MAKGSVSRNANPWAGRLRAVGKGLKFVAGAARAAHSIKKSFSKTVKAKASSGDAGVMTNQFDTKLLYRRPKQSKRKRRKQNAFAQKVQKVISQQDSHCTWVVNQCQATTATAGNQGISDVSLFGVDGASFTSNGDVQAIYASFLGAGSNASPIAQGSRLSFQSAQMDVFILNNGASTTVVDVYCLVPKRDINYSSSNGQNAQQLLGSLLNLNQTAGNPVTGTVLPGFTTPGVGPFESTEFCREFTVLEKRRFILTTGQVGTMEMKVYPKKHKPMSYQQFQTQITASNTAQTPLYKKGWSKIYLFTYYALGNDGSVNAATTYPSASVGITAQKTYKFTMHANKYQLATADAAGSVFNFNNPQ